MSETSTTPPVPTEPPARPDAARAGKAKAWIKEQPPARLATLLAAVGLLLTAPFGGWKMAELTAPAELSAAEAVAAPPFDVTIERVVTLDSLGNLAEPATAGGSVLCLVAKVVVTADAPVYRTVLAKAFVVNHADIEPWPRDSTPRAQVFSRLDDSQPEAFQPGVPYDIAACYPQKPGWQRQDVRVTVFGFEWAEDQQYRLWTPEWRRRDPVAVGVFEVEEVS